jgi:hypothetical protein
MGKGLTGKNRELRFFQGAGTKDTQTFKQKLEGKQIATEGYGGCKKKKGKSERSDITHESRRGVGRKRTGSERGSGSRQLCRILSIYSFQYTQYKQRRRKRSMRVRGLKGLRWKDFVETRGPFVLKLD